MSNNEITAEQNGIIQSLHKTVAAKVVDALSKPRLGGEFITASNAAGFYFAFKEIVYNYNALRSLDYLVKKTGDTYSLGDAFSGKYLDTIDAISFSFSDSDDDLMNDENNKTKSELEAIINLYHSGILPDTKATPTFADVKKAVESELGCKYTEYKVTDAPDFAPIISKMLDYAHSATNLMRLTDNKTDADKKLAAIKEHMQTPSEKNGGLPVIMDENVKKYALGWEDLPNTEDLRKSLKNENNALTLEFRMNNFSGANSSLHLGSQETKVLPVAWIFGIRKENSKETTDITQYAQSNASIDITMTFTGITLVPATPQPLSLDNTRGWFDGGILMEAAKKSGDKNASGYKLMTGQLDPKTLFGPEGTLKRLKNYVISAQPEIHAEFKNFDADGMEKIISRQSNVEVSLFGIFKVGGKDSNYSSGEFTKNAQQQTIAIDFKPAKPGAGADFFKQSAFILGGVPETY